MATGHKDSSGKFHPHTTYNGVRKSRDQSEKTQGVRLKRSDVSLNDRQKTILSNWVKKNRNWTTIDDLPSEIFIPLVAPARDDIDKRVSIQMKAIDYMKQVSKELNKERDPHEGGQAVLDTLFASNIKGKPFFVASGIKDFVLFGENEVMFNKIPKNPNHIAKITVLVDRGSDSFTARFYHKDEFLPALEEKELYVDQLAPALANGLGIEH